MQQYRFKKIHTFSRHFSLACFSLFFFSNIAKAQTENTANNRFSNIVIKTTHPRIWIDGEKQIALKVKYKGKTPDEVQQLAGPSIIGMALTYIITGDRKWGVKAIETALAPQTDPGSVFYDLNTKEGRGKSRSIQSKLADQAICYDWCYPLLSAEQKQQFRDLMLPEMKKAIAFKRAWRSFHNSLYAHAWPLTAATIALYGDEPYATESFNFLKPELEDVMQTFEKVFPDGEWGEGMDYNRHSTYHAIRIFLAIKSATGFDALAKSAHIKNTGKYIIYSAKPNGLALPDDDNDWPYVGDWEHVALLMLNEEFRDGYNQYFINHCPAERFKLEPEKQYAQVLWYNAAIKEKSLTQLPLARIFRGKGLVIARSNWNFDTPKKRAGDAWLSFHCGDYFGDHVHNDINNLNIYYKGNQSIDAGRYDDDWDAVISDPNKIVQSQFFNYYKRSIAHNTMLVYDSSEKMSEQLLNDGGQTDQLRIDTKDGKLGPRNVPEDYAQGNYPSEEGAGKCDWATNPGRWETGDIISYKATSNFMYVCGDGTKAYSPNKLKSFIRQIVFVQPNIIVTMDKVIAKDARFKKTWLMHSDQEPVIHSNNNSFTLTNDEGKLICIPILPHKIDVSKIGGEGNECLVGTTHFPFGLKSAFDPTALHYGEDAGAWRIEESPTVAANEDYFLNVMMVADKNSTEIPAVKIVSENAEEIAIQIKTSDGKATTIKFGQGGTPLAHIKINNGAKLLINERMPDKIELESGREK